MKRLTALLMIVVLAFGLTACGNKVGDIELENNQNVIYIQEDGSVTYAVSESFDKDYYDEDDLEDKIDNEVAEYNNSGKASIRDAIEVDRFKVKKGTATLVLNFATVYDFFTYAIEYNRFAEDKFYAGAIADNSECGIKGDFISPDKKESRKGKEIKKMTDAEILIVNEQYKVQIDGTVQYISTNCKIDEDGIITTAKVDDGISYIVYNND